MPPPSPSRLLALAALWALVSASASTNTSSTSQGLPPGAPLFAHPSERSCGPAGTAGACVVVHHAATMRPAAYLSKQAGVLFVHVPKAAGTSLRTVWPGRNSVGRTRDDHSTLADLRGTAGPEFTPRSR